MAIDPPNDLRSVSALLKIMETLRDPDGGCPWDIEQTFDTIAPYTLEEAYEVADTIERKDFAALKDELGDLLFQVVYHAQMASEAGHFSFDDVVECVNERWFVGILMSLALLISKLRMGKPSPGRK